MIDWRFGSLDIFYYKSPFEGRMRLELSSEEQAAGLAHTPVLSNWIQGGV